MPCKMKMEEVYNIFSSHFHFKMHYRHLLSLPWYYTNMLKLTGVNTLKEMYPVLMTSLLNVSQFGWAAYRNTFIKFHPNPSMTSLNEILYINLIFTVVEGTPPKMLLTWLQMNLFLAPSIDMNLYWFLLYGNLGKMEVECFPPGLQSSNWSKWNSYYKDNLFIGKIGIIFQANFFIKCGSI